MASPWAASSDSPTAPTPAQPFFTVIRERLETPFPGVTSATVAGQSAGGAP